MEHTVSPTEKLQVTVQLGKTYSAKKLATLGTQFKNATDLSWQAFGPRAFRRSFPGEEKDPLGAWEMRQPNKALFDVVMLGFSCKAKSHYWPHLEAIRESLIDLMASDAKFQDSITSGTSDPRRLNYRFTTWMARLDEILDEEPQARTFSTKLKRELFAASPICELCGQEIRDLDDAHVHHVKHYWRGGKTIPENAAVTHRFCNLSEGGGAPVPAVEAVPPGATDTGTGPLATPLAREVSPMTKS